MSTRHDDPQFRDLCSWYNGEAECERRDPKSLRWQLLVFFGALAIALTLLVAGAAEAGGTVTDSKYIWLQRSGVTLTDKTTPKLACPISTMTECIACMVEMYDEERRRRTSGYVTYRCLDATQAYVKFNTTPIVLPPPPPQASLQVYSCADAGSDGRILESATIAWPNCQAASYQNPSRSLVVATNDDGVLLWRLASKVTTGRVGTQTGTAWAWTPVGDINWGTAPPPPPPAGTGNLTWTPSPSPNVAGYRLLYGTSPDALTLSVDVIPPEPRVFKVPGLKSGQLYHFRMQAYRADGVHGPLSNLLSVTIQ